MEADFEALVSRQNSITMINEMWLRAQTPRLRLKGKAESGRRILSYCRFSHGFVSDNFPADIFLQSSVLSRILPDTFELVLSQKTDKCIK